MLAGRHHFDTKGDDAVGSALADLEVRGNTAIVRFRPREELHTADREAMMALWSAFDTVHLEARPVVLFEMPRDYLAPRLVDDFWQRAKQAPVDVAPIGGRALPRMVAVADASMRRSLTFLASLPAFSIASVQGEIDFDLLGLPLACKYRICSSDTTFVNRTLGRKMAPGSAAPWFLARLIGRARTRKLYLDEVTLTANEALDLGIVDRVVDADAIDDEGIAIANRFEEYDAAAQQTLSRAMEAVGLDLGAYLEQAGTGF